MREGGRKQAREGERERGREGSRLHTYVISMSLV